jgi:hypothetical protein
MGMSLGAVVAQGSVSHTNTTAKTLFSLPPGAVPLFAVVHTSVAFNDSGTDLLSIGAGSVATYFASGINVGAIGGQMIVLNQVPNLERQTQVTVTYTGANGNSSAGRARISLVYATPFDPA